MAALGAVRLTIVLGRYAQAWHLPQTLGPQTLGPETLRAPLTHTVRDWLAQWPDRLLLPHPSPRNAGWLRKNPWFEAELLPALRARVAEVLAEA